MHQDNAKVFMAFCDVTRLRILELLRDFERSATVLQQQIGTGQSTLSHHMKILVESGIVAARKSGKWTYYSLCEAGGRYASELLNLLTSNSKIAELNNSDININTITEKRRPSTMKQFTIVADTSCDLPPEYIKEHDIKLMQIPFTLDGEEKNSQTVSDKAFYDALRNGSIVKTSLINSDMFVDSFSEYAKNGEDALYVILSSGLSGTYQASQIALAQIKELYPSCKIFPIDSIGATAVNGLLVMLAVKKREEGLSAEETAAWLEEKKNSLLGFFTVDDLMYLHRGGRLSMLSAIGGSLLSIKPVLNIQPDGTLALKNKVRGRTAALKMLVSQLKRSIAPDARLDTVLIPHTDCEKDALKLAELVKAEINVRQVIITMMTPVIGAHVGPGAVAVVFEGDITREAYENNFYK